MQATEYGSNKIISFNENNIIYVIQDGYECKTHFKNGKELSLSLNEMDALLYKMPRVFSYKYGCATYLNPKEISTYSSWGYVTVEFNNGEVLHELSRADFKKNVISKIEKER